LAVHRPTANTLPLGARGQTEATQLCHRLADTTLPPGASCKQWPPVIDLELYRLAARPAAPGAIPVAHCYWFLALFTDLKASNFQYEFHTLILVINTYHHAKTHQVQSIHVQHKIYHVPILPQNPS